MNDTTKKTKQVYNPPFTATTCYQLSTGGYVYSICRAGHIRWYFRDDRHGWYGESKNRAAAIVALQILSDNNH